MTERPRNRSLATLLGLLVAAVTSATVAAQTPPQTDQPREYAAWAASNNPTWPLAPVRAPKAMVVSDEKLASDAGVEIMKKGGNAVDAAVAVAFALAVVEPEAGNIGGGGFMLVRLANGRTGFVDYREVAPKKASRDMYVRADGTFDAQAPLVGYRAVAVPGTAAGLALALRTYGTLKLVDVIAPAIRLADGFPVGERLAHLLHEDGAVLSKFPASQRIFLKNGAYFAPGDILRQPELAATLRRIARNGPDEFYRGQTARDLADEMQREGGLIGLDDLAQYKPSIREPLTASYDFHGHKWELITSPPPSSGGVATIEALNILAPLELKGWDDPDSVHWVIEAMRRVFADRAAYLADPDFANLPIRGLASVCYANALRGTIDSKLASDSHKVTAGNPAAYGSSASSSGGCAPAASAAKAVDSQVAAGSALAEAMRGGHTTHFSVVDPAGNAVSNTYTINDFFGSGVTSADGFLLNNEMDDFTTHPGSPNMYGLVQSEANTVAAGKRPLSSMMPTILLRDGQLSFVTGSPGGPTIISATLLSILNWMRLGLDAQAAINAPRFHHQWLPDEVVFEPGLPEALIKDLAGRGYRFAPNPHWIGEVEAIGIDPATGERLGAADPRRNGAAASY
jgi:gamma-glutamyltranspeptidase/glutathione hydrolase